MTAPHSLVMDLVAAYVENDRARVAEVAAEIDASGHIAELLEVINLFATNVLLEKHDVVARLEPGRIHAEILTRLTVLPAHEELSIGTAIDDMLAGRMVEAITTASAGGGLRGMHLAAAYIAAVADLTFGRATR
ncbi:hypothetical protein [Nocardia sp. CA-120079]|uniref:hypothetical protein n=1 Tax=Nocardia sp. CA-120079 TaxID=3239974 RepID=UPI003D98DB76